MRNSSLWKSISKKPQSYPRLEKDIEVDVAIIGGGITGMTAAHHLLNAGKKVALFEANEVGGADTSFSSSNLYVAVQPYYQNIVSKFNLETAKGIAHARLATIDFIEALCKEKNFNCNFSRRPWFIYTDDDKELSLIDKEVETFKQMDIPIEYVSDMPFPFKFKKAALIQNQARFNCLQYVYDLAADAAKRGCQIFENTRIMDMEENEVCHLKTSSGKVTANKVLVATHTPVGINIVQTLTAPYRSYVVAAMRKDQAVPEGHFWDLSSPHHATCTHSTTGEKPDLVLVAGSHHKVGQAEDANAHYDELASFLRTHLGIEHIDYQWSAQHYHSADGIPYIGPTTKSSKHSFMATGFFADGLIYGTLAAAIVSDLLLEKNNELSEKLKPYRFLKAGSKFLKENMNVYLQYLKDFPILSKANLDEIKKGEGKVVQIDNEKWAVSRDEQGKLNFVSAVCTHMKCIVNWNNAERTWDCPCHGSRFTTDGKVIEGPATECLKKKES